jgi:glutamate racemase
MNEKLRDLPIGVFDSGVGGLTVLRALQKKLPHESFLYLGDTARLPYGTKSPETINRYVLQASSVLIERGIKFLVIACNTAASTVNLVNLQAQMSNIGLISVLEPGAKVACETSQTGTIAVIATETTVNSQGYQNAIQRLRPDAHVIAKSCSLFVPLAEEGWVDGSIVRAVAKKYLNELFIEQLEKPIDCLVLGCTHFPALIKTIRKVIGDKIMIVDSAVTTANAVEDILRRDDLLKLSSQSSTTFLVTDAPERFTRVAKQFLDWKLERSLVELVDFANK